MKQAKDLGKILLDNEQVIAIHPAEEWKDIEISDTLWIPNKKEAARINVRYLKDYLSFPYIEDACINHWKRREFQQKLVDEHGAEMYDFLSRDALKGGFAYFMMGAQLLGIKNAYTKDKEQLSLQIGKVSEGLPEKKVYDLEMKTPQKIKVMREQKQRIHTFLQFLSNKS